MKGTEKLTRDHGPGYRRYAKRKWSKFVRRESRKNPEEAPRKVRSNGWA